MCTKVQTKNAPKDAGAIQKEGEEVQALEVAKKASEDRKEAEKDAA
jgi:hypothetical protein